MAADNAAVKKNTAEFVDCVNTGDYTNALWILETEDLNLSFSLSSLRPYMRTKVPKVRIDVLNSWNSTEPIHPIGCMFIHNCSDLFERVMESPFKPGHMTDTDAFICIYMANIKTFECALTHYPGTLLNHRSRGSFHSSVKHLTCFNPIFMYCFTPIHTALISCFVYNEASIHYTRTLSFFKRQSRKLHILINSGGYLDGVSSYALSIAGQLLFHSEFDLFEKCVNVGLIGLCREEMGIFFNQFIRYYKTGAIKYIFRSPFCRDLDFMENDVFLGHDSIIRKGYLRRIDATQRSEITEIIVNNNFTFTGNASYNIRICDSPTRIYNLYHAGVYITDRYHNYSLMNMENPVVLQIGRILVKCKSPFLLERLAGLKVKSILGPKNYYHKLTLLVGILPLHVLYSLAFIKFTKGLQLPSGWYIPEERIGDKPYSHVFRPPRSED